VNLADSRATGWWSYPPFTRRRSVGIGLDGQSADELNRESGQMIESQPIRGGKEVQR